MKQKRQRVRTQDVIEIRVADLACAKDLPPSHSIWKLIHPEDAVQQVTCLKQITDQLLRDPGDPLNLPIMEILMLAFMNCPIKNPSKRVIASCMQKLAGKEEYSCHLRKSISNYLCDQFLEAEGTDLIVFNKIHENISILLENFAIGEDGLIATELHAPVFMMKCLCDLENAIRTKSLMAISKSEHMGCCLRVVKNFNKLLPRLPPSVFGEANSEDFVEIERTFVKSLMAILSDGSFQMDCRITCGITLALLFKVHNDENYVSETMHNLLGKEITQVTNSSSAWQHKDVDFRTWRSGLEVLSQLCIVNGCLAVINDEDLVDFHEDSGFVLTNVIGPELVQLTQGLSDVNTKLMASRTLLLFTAKMSTCLKYVKAEHEDLLRNRLSHDGDLMNQLMQYAWNHWEDQTDALRHQAVDIFHNVIKCRMAASSIDPKEDVFLSDLTKSLLALDWSSKGKYEPLRVLVEYLTTSHMLTLTPDLPKLILFASWENAIASYANELLEKLFSNHYRELTLQPNVNPDFWNDTWVVPVLEALCSKNKHLRQNIIQYTIPKILKCNPESLFYIKEKLASNNNDLHCLGALVTCLKRAKMMGILKTLSQSWNDVWTDSLPTAIMRHPDEQVRLDTYGLLCENIKTTEALSEHDIELIKDFLPLNLWSQNPAFRQQLDAYSKKLYIRLRESAQPLLKAMRKKNTEQASEAEIKLLEYKRFVEWLVDLMFDNFHQGASFPGRTTALSLLSTLVKIFGDDVKDADAVPWCYLLENITIDKVQTLLECFNDTFDINKQEAFYILKSLPRESHGFESKEVLENLLGVALDLASSTNPQECTTAAYLFRYLMLQPGVAEVVNQLSLQKPVPHEWTQMKDVDKTPADTLEIRQSLRRATKVCVLQLDASASCDIKWRSLQMLQLLLSHLEDQLAIANRSLVNAAATRPMYPTLHCIRQVLEDSNLKALAGHEEWKEFIMKLIKTSFEVAKVVSPVVQNSSPEGNVPEESIIGPGLSLGAMSDSDGKEMSEIIQDSAATVCLMPEYLVVCCWRSIKEVSLMLGQLAQFAPIARDGVPGLMNRDQLQEIGEFFTVQLLESRHRGAFELAYAGFVKMTEMLWKCPVEDIHQWPSLWLDDVMKDIRSCDPNSRLCSTRRSAGVPFYVQALVSTEPNFQGRPCFKNVMKELIDLAQPRDDNVTEENTAQVHALNVLRALFRDTRLSEDVFPFIGDGLQVAVLGYASKFWSVRNSSTLLFSCLMTRIFGVNRSKEDASKKNCLTGRVFFHRYPNLFPFLLEQLSLASRDIGDVTKLQPGLYPVLMVLGRLMPSVMEATEPNINLAAFIPLVVKCDSSGIFKTRLMSARALAPLVGSDYLMSTLQMLIGSLQAKNGLRPCQNVIHGSLLQLQYILKSLGDLPDAVMEKVASFVVPSLLESSEWILSRENDCLITKSSCLELALVLSKMKWSSLPEEINANLKKLELMIISLSKEHINEESIPWSPWLSQFKQVMMRVMLANYTMLDTADALSTLKNGISSPVYEVRIDVLAFLQLILTSNEDEFDSQWSDVDRNVWDLNQEQLCDISKAVKDSKELVACLWKMCVTEKHPDCLAEVLKTLALYSAHVESGYEEMTPKSTLEMMDFLLNLWTYAREEVCCSGLELSGSLVTHLYRNQAEGDCRPPYLEMLQRWVLLLQDRCRMENSEDCRMSCAKVLVQNAPLLLLDPTGILGEKCLDLWALVFRLLLDEEEDIRVTMATVITKLSTYSDAVSTTCPVQSECVIDLCLKVICQDLGPRHPALVGKALGLWTMQDLESDIPDSDSKKVRLFDRSELNTYRDNLAFSKLVSGHLLEFLTTTNGQLEQQVAEIFSKETKLLEVKLDKAEPDNLAFLHTPKWKDYMFHACRLTFILKTLNQLGYESHDLNECKKMLENIFRILQTSNHFLSLNNLLQKMNSMI